MGRDGKDRSPQLIISSRDFLGHFIVTLPLTLSFTWPPLFRKIDSSNSNLPTLVWREQLK